MIETIHEHLVETALLPERAKILDIGCRGFLFTDHFEKLGHTVYPVDADELPFRKYIRMAITDYDGVAAFVKTEDAQASHITDAGLGNGDPVWCCTMQTFGKKVGIEFWDLIKMDIEGSEYQVIMSLDMAPAKQLSVEFHLHCGKYGMHEMDLMLDKLKALGYRTASHELTNQHGAGENWWSSLFILKS